MRWVARIALTVSLAALLATTATGQLTEVADRVRPAVGFVLVTLPDGGAVSGTGFVVDRAGFILTASHIFDGGAQKVAVSLPGRATLDADLWDRDKRRDMAVLKVPAEDLPVLTFATALPKQAEEILLFGFPLADVLGAGQVTVTRGIVSAFNERLQLLQVDAASNPGNSGGPVVNGKGEVVGMLIGGLRDASGLNFVVPAAPLKEFAEVYVGRPRPEISAQPTPSEILASRLVLGLRMGPVIVDGTVSSLQAMWGEPDTKEASKSGTWWNYVTRRVFILIEDNRVFAAITMSPAYRTEQGWGVGRTSTETKVLFGGPQSTERVKDGTIWGYYSRGFAAVIRGDKVEAVMVFKPIR